MSAKGGVAQGPALDQHVLNEILQRLPFGVIVWRLETPDEASSFRLIHAHPAASIIAGQYVGKPLFEAFPYLAGTSIPERILKVLREGQA